MRKLPLFSTLCFLLSTFPALCASQPVFEIKVSANGDVISSTLPSNGTVNFPAGTHLKINGVDVGVATWGNIVGTLSNQTDLQSALNAKETAGAAATAQAYAIQRANHTGTQSADTITDGTTNKAYTATEKTKLAGIAAGATANSTDAQLRDRSTHTGTQLLATVSDAGQLATWAAIAPASAVQSLLGAFNKANANAALTDDDFAFVGTANIYTAKQTLRLTTNQVEWGYDASNYLRLTVDSAGNSIFANSGSGVVIFGGTSANPATEFDSTGATSYLKVQATSGGNNRLWFGVQPSGTFVASIDNFSLEFRTNNSARWSIATTGHFLASTDNTYDIGASAANRPRDLNLGRNAIIGGTVSSKGTSTAPTTISASDIDWSTSNVFSKTLAANTTFAFSNNASGQVIVVALTNTASNYTVTWPTVSWPGGIAPTQTTGAKTDVYTFVKVGAVIYGSVQQNF